MKRDNKGYKIQNFVNVNGMRLIIIWLFLACLTVTSILSQERKPNFIIILADDLGYGDISTYGNTEISTPRLDAMAKEGLKFTDFHSNGAVCSPTRASLMTGMYPARAGIPNVVNAADKDMPGLDTAFVTLPEMLKKAGYATGMFGKWHLGYNLESNPVLHGFDEFKGFVSGNIDYFSHIDRVGAYDWWHGMEIATDSGYLTEIITDFGIDFMERNKDNPFFLYLPHGAPHSPLQGPDSGPHRGVDGMSAPPRNIDTFRSVIEAMDHEIGRVIDKVKELGIEENTFVIFFSDNGPIGNFTNTGPFSGRKSQVLEGGHRVSSIAWWEGQIPAGVESGELVAGFDLYPTLAAWAGITVEGLDGSNVSEVFLENGTLPERTLYFTSGDNIGVRRGDWKLNRIGGNINLYNLSEDPREIGATVIDDEPEITAALIDTMSILLEAAQKTIPQLNWELDPTTIWQIDGPGETSVKIDPNREVRVELFSLDGRKLFSVIRSGGRFTDTDMKAISTGLYYARFADGNGNTLGAMKIFHNP